MFENIKTTTYDSNGQEVKTVTTTDVVLEALSMRLEQLKMSDDFLTPESLSKMGMLEMAIDDIKKNTV